jgi:hypothetical protein
MFEPGTKVVCIDDLFSQFITSLYPSLPENGTTYTVRDIVPGIEPTGAETVACYLAEIAGPVNKHGIELGFACYRFRELDELTETEAEKASDELVIV